MSKPKRKRRQMWIDRKVQGALVLHCILYWTFCLLTITLLLTCWRILTEPAQMFADHLSHLWLHGGPALIASFLLLPIVVFDIVILSNRFVGPMFRLRRAMRQLANGEKVPPVHFREDDFWREVSKDFNLLAEKVQLANSIEREKQTTLVGAGYED